MADISQVKLPNGDTYNLVDETSGYKKFHEVNFTLPIGGSPTVETTFAQLKSWIDAGDLVILINSSIGNIRFYLYSVSNDTLIFRSPFGLELDITANNTEYYSYEFITIDDLPIYDGTVE